MKHNGQFRIVSALPDAPLTMPKQQLEMRRHSLFDALRNVFSVFAGR